MSIDAFDASLVTKEANPSKPGRVFCVRTDAAIGLLSQMGVPFTRAVDAIVHFPAERVVFTVGDRALTPWGQAEVAKAAKAARDIPPEHAIPSSIDEGVIQPPYDLNALSWYLEHNTWHASCVRIKATAVAGLGHRVIPTSVLHGYTGGNASGQNRNIGKMVSYVIKAIRGKVSGEQKQLEAERARISSFLDFPGKPCSFDESTERVGTDFFGLGNGYFELVRNSRGKLAGMTHAPGLFMRAMARKNPNEPQVYLWDNGQEAQRKYLIEYGRYQEVRGVPVLWVGNRRTGKCLLDAGENVAEIEKWRMAGEIANEVLHRKNYHMRNSYYGLPDIIPALQPMIIEEAVDDHNLAYFENHTVPSYIIVFTGGSPDAQAEIDIKMFFETYLKGQPHRPLVLSAPIDEQGNPGDVKVTPLANKPTDASFLGCKRACREEIIAADRTPHGMIVPPEGGLGGKGYSEAEVRRFKTQIIDIEQNRFEAMVNLPLHLPEPVGLGLAHWSIMFNEIDVTDREQMARIADMVRGLTQDGIIDRNEARAQLDMEPRDGGNVALIYGKRVLYPADDEKLIREMLAASFLGKNAKGADKTRAKDQEAEAEIVGDGK